MLRLMFRTRQSLPGLEHTYALARRTYWNESYPDMHVTDTIQHRTSQVQQEKWISNGLLMSHHSTPWHELRYSMPRSPRDSVNCCKRDFSTTHYDQVKLSSDFYSHENKIKTEVALQNPDVVVLQNLQEQLFIMRMNSIFRKLGYKGSFEDIKRGRGNGVFLRNDRVHIPLKSVYQSWRPDPM